MRAASHTIIGSETRLIQNFREVHQGEGASGSPGDQTEHAGVTEKRLLMRPDAMARYEELKRENEETGAKKMKARAQHERAKTLRNSNDSS